MANLVEVTTLLDGSRQLFLHVYVKGDGSGDLNAVEIADPADFDMPGTNQFFTLEGIQAALNGFSASLKFDYLINGTFIWAIPEYQSEYDFNPVGGLKDRSDTLDGTGKVLLSTVGLADGDEGSFVIKLRK
jgi:hypothetical protein